MRRVRGHRAVAVRRSTPRQRKGSAGEQGGAFDRRGMGADHPRRRPAPCAANLCRADARGGAFAARRPVALHGGSARSRSARDRPPARPPADIRRGGTRAGRRAPAADRETALKLLELTLGIMTAVGGFVDISELVFAAQAGSRFGYALIWVLIISTVGIMVFGEMSGRVAAIAKQPVFNLMRHRLGLKMGLPTLIASLISNLITCAAEVGGVALVLHLLTGAPYMLMAVAATIALIASVWVFPFKWIERVYGLLGLFMIVFAAALVALHPPWAQVGQGAVPHIPAGLSNRELIPYAYFSVAIVSAVMFPYETYFYSSGGIEEKWGPKDLGINRVTTIVGFALGSLLAISLLASSAQLFAPLHIDPQMPGTVAMEAAIPYGRTGLLLALLGMLFAIGGAAVETCLSNAYSLAQFFGWEWGRYETPWAAPSCTITWLAVFALSLLIVLSGIEPVELVDYAIVFSILVLPLTYLPLLLLASDRTYMREHANGVIANTLGWIYYAVIVVAAIVALPLFFLTSGGQK